MASAELLHQGRILLRADGVGAVSQPGQKIPQGTGSRRLAGLKTGQDRQERFPGGFAETFSVR